MLQNLAQQIKECLETEDRKDIEFRALIAVSQISDIIKYITHDPKLNPNARPFGCREDEKLAYGQLILQLAVLMHIRDIDFNESFEIAMKHWVEKDWKKKQQNEDKISGKIASKGRATGRAFIVKKSSDLESIKDGDIVVMESPSSFSVQLSKKIRGIITDNGGMLCHSAIIAREFSIPCIVGTGNATQRIPHGKEITIDAVNGEVIL